MAEGSSFTESNYNKKVHKKQKKKLEEDNASDSLVSYKLAFSALAILCIVYSGLFWTTHRSLYGMHVTPLPENAPLDKFSEGRTMKHIWHLAHEIGIRQVALVIVKCACSFKSPMQVIALLCVP